MTIVVEFFKEENGKLVNPCGTEYTHVMDDIKTVRGAKNRINRKGYCIPKYAVEYRIYATSNVMNEDSYRLLEKVNIER